MKRVIWLFFIFSILLCAKNNAQSLTPIKDKFNNGPDKVMAWKVTVVPKPDVLKRAFKNFIRERYNINLKGIGLFNNKDVLTAKEVALARVSSKRINLYASVLDNNGTSDLRVFASHGEKNYINDKQKEEFKALKVIVIDFLNDYLPKFYDYNLELATQNFGKIVKQGDNLRAKIEANKKRILELHNQNKQLTQNIEQNKQTLIQSKKELIKRQDQLDSIKKQLNAIIK